MTEVKVFCTPDELQTIYKQWQALVNQSKSTPFQSPSWLLTWYKYFGSGELRVLTIRDGDELIFIAPLFIRKLDTENERKLVFIGTGNTDYLDCIYKEFFYEGFDSLLVYIADMKAEWNVCDLSDIHCSSPLINYLNAACYDTCPVLKIKGSYENYLHSTFTNKRLYNTRRMEKKLQQEGELVFEMVSHANNITGENKSHSPDEENKHYSSPDASGNHSPFILNAVNSKEKLTTLVNDFTLLHRKRWPGESSLNDPVVKDFLFESVPLLFEEGYAKIFRLQYNKTTIAAELVFVKDETLYDYLIAYDPDYDKYSPGFLLKLKIIEWCFNNNIRYFDFLKGKEDYKYSFGAKDTSTFRINFP